MKRDILNELQNWRNDNLRNPLILRGARQVGKSWVIDEFGKQFDNYICINFEKEKSAIALFQGDFRVNELVEKIIVYTKEPVIPGRTLLFFDETQLCPECLIALRYFKEEMPQLHVIAAGSLLEFALEKVGLPVGRVQIMYLYPLSFGEFLTATDNDILRQYLFKKNIDAANHQKLMELLKTYLWLGGMPGVVAAWLQEKNVIKCQNLQNYIIETYKQDFTKYAHKYRIEYVEKIFAAIPPNLGKKFKYSNVDKEIRSQFLKNALLLLAKANVIHLVYHSSGHENPLGATKDETKFKVFFIDVGLAHHMLGLDLKNWAAQQMDLKTLGSIAEQFVAQEIIAYTATHRKAELYYWHREAKSSNAEVDFLLIKNGQIVPVEVKAGKTGSFRSMQQFLIEHPKSKYGLKIAEGLFLIHDHLEQIPLYGIEAWLNN